MNLSFLTAPRETESSAAPVTSSRSPAAARNFVQTAGRPEGRVLLLAHGFGCDQNMWRHLTPALIGQFRLVLFDHVGAGRSDLAAYDRTTYSTLDGYAADVIDICDEMGLTEVTMIGHSVSAMIAVTAAARRPDLFAHLVLVAPSPRFVDAPGYVGGFSHADIDDLLESLDSNYFGWAAAMAPAVMGSGQPAALTTELTESFCRMRPDIAYDFARVTFLSDARPLLRQVSTPTLILQCSDDMLAPVEVGRYLAHELSGSTFVQLAATGHCPHISAPGETAAAILDYLARD